MEVWVGWEGGGLYGAVIRPIMAPFSGGGGATDIRGRTGPLDVESSVGSRAT